MGPRVVLAWHQGPTLLLQGRHPTPCKQCTLPSLLQQRGRQAAVHWCWGSQWRGCRLQQRQAGLLKQQQQRRRDGRRWSRGMWVRQRARQQRRVLGQWVPPVSSNSSSSSGNGGLGG